MEAAGVLLEMYTQCAMRCAVNSPFVGEHRNRTVNIKYLWQMATFTHLSTFAIEIRQFAIVFFASLFIHICASIERRFILDSFFLFLAEIQMASTVSVRSFSVRFSIYEECSALAKGHTREEKKRKWCDDGWVYEQCSWSQTKLHSVCNSVKFIFHFLRSVWVGCESNLHRLCVDWRYFRSFLSKKENFLHSVFHGDGVNGNRSHHKCEMFIVTHHNDTFDGAYKMQHKI